MSLEVVNKQRMPNEDTKAEYSAAATFLGLFPPKVEFWTDPSGVQYEIKKPANINYITIDVEEILYQLLAPLKEFPNLTVPRSSKQELTLCLLACKLCDQKQDLILGKNWQVPISRYFKGTVDSLLHVTERDPSLLKQENFNQPEFIVIEPHCHKYTFSEHGIGQKKEVDDGKESHSILIEAIEAITLLRNRVMSPYNDMLYQLKILDQSNVELCAIPQIDPEYFEYLEKVQTIEEAVIYELQDAKKRIISEIVESFTNATNADKIRIEVSIEPSVTSESALADTNDEHQVIKAVFDDSQFTAFSNEFQLNREQEKVLKATLTNCSKKNGRWVLAYQTEFLNLLSDPTAGELYDKVQTALAPSEAEATLDKKELYERLADLTYYLRRRMALDSSEDDRIRNAKLQIIRYDQTIKRPTERLYEVLAQYVFEFKNTISLEQFKIAAKNLDKQIKNYYQDTRDYRNRHRTINVCIAAIARKLTIEGDLDHCRNKNPLENGSSPLDKLLPEIEESFEITVSKLNPTECFQLASKLIDIITHSDVPRPVINDIGEKLKILFKKIRING